MCNTPWVVQGRSSIATATTISTPRLCPKQELFVSTASSSSLPLFCCSSSPPPSLDCCSSSSLAIHNQEHSTISSVPDCPPSEEMRNEEQQQQRWKIQTTTNQSPTRRTSSSSSGGRVAIPPPLAGGNKRTTTASTSNRHVSTTTTMTIGSNNNSVSSTASRRTADSSAVEDEKLLFFLSCPPPPPRGGIDNFPTQEVQRSTTTTREQQEQEDEFVTSTKTTNTDKRLSSSRSSSAAASEETPRNLFLPRPSRIFQGIATNTRKRRASDKDGPLAMATSCYQAFSASSSSSFATSTGTQEGHDDIMSQGTMRKGASGNSCMDDGGDEDTDCGNTKKQQLLQHDKHTLPPPTSPYPTTPVLSINIDPITSSPSNPISCALTASSVNGIQPISTPIPVRATATPSIAMRRTSASPFSTCSYSKELSRIGNLTIQSPGSSFTAYRSPFKYGSYPPNSYINTHHFDNHHSPSGMLPTNLLKQNPRQVPIALVTVDKSLKSTCVPTIAPPSYSQSSDAIPSSHGDGAFPFLRPTASPNCCVQHDDSCCDERYHGVNIPNIGETVLPPRHDNTLLSPNSPSRVLQDASENNSDACNGANISPQAPVAFLDMNAPPRQRNKLSSFQSLFKQTSNDALDDFFHSDDVSLGSSLTESGDEGDWFFLCEPKLEASPTDCAHQWKRKKHRSSFLHVNPNRIPKLPFPTTDPKVASKDVDYADFCKRFRRPESNVSMIELSAPGCHDNFGESKEPPSHRKRTPVAVTALNQHDESSMQQLQNTAAPPHASSGDLLLDHGVETRRRDLVTPPVSMFHETSGPPPLKTNYHRLKSITSLFGDDHVGGDNF